MVLTIIVLSIIIVFLIFAIINNNIVIYQIEKSMEQSLNEIADIFAKSFNNVGEDWKLSIKEFIMKNCDNVERVEIDLFINGLDIESFRLKKEIKKVIDSMFENENDS